METETTYNTKKNHNAIKTFGIDFDGTCLTHDFPFIGKDIGAVKVLRKIVDNGHRLILFTMRSDKKNVIVSRHNPEILNVQSDYLTQAVNWFKENKLPLYGINEDPFQAMWTDSPKAYCNIYIDDCGLGIPLIYGKHEKPYVDWVEVEKILEKRGLI